MERKLRYKKIDSLVIPYEEKRKAAAMLQKAGLRYQYDRTQYWHPLRPVCLRRCMYFDVPLLDIEQRFSKIHPILYQHKKNLYMVPLASITENIYKMNHQQFVKYYRSCAEYAMIPEDCTWLVYKSHESTVTFAGDIAPEVLEILQDADGV